MRSTCTLFIFLVVSIIADVHLIVLKVQKLVRWKFLRSSISTSELLGNDNTVLKDDLTQVNRHFHDVVERAQLRVCRMIA